MPANTPTVKSFRQIKSFKGCSLQLCKVDLEQLVGGPVFCSWCSPLSRLATDNKVRISLDTQMSLLNDTRGLKRKAV